MTPSSEGELKGVRGFGFEGQCGVAHTTPSLLLAGEGELKGVIKSSPNSPFSIKLNPCLHIPFEIVRANYEKMQPNKRKSFGTNI